jgi:prepilin-type N-terminal cleavage/methylation domain-containing protein/prepilin-type processing-associated H-X9-DG protein
MRKPKHGFTLVELLVVIGIIAVLISILLPALGRARQTAYKTQCASNLHQFFLADLQYVNDTKGWHLPGYWGTYQFNRVWTGIDQFREGVANPILDRNATTGNSATVFCYVQKKWYCPLAQRGFTAGVLSSETGMTLYPMNYSTGMNVEGVDSDYSSIYPAAWDSTNAPHADPTLPNNSAFHGYKDSMVHRPAEKLMFADASWIVLNETGSGPQTLRSDGKISNYDLTGDRTSSGNYDVSRTTAWRHQDYANVCFFDGHVQGLRKDEIYSHDSAGNIVGNDALWKVMQ